MKDVLLERFRQRVFDVRMKLGWNHKPAGEDLADLSKIYFRMALAQDDRLSAFSIAFWRCVKADHTARQEIETMVREFGEFAAQFIADEWELFAELALT